MHPNDYYKLVDYYFTKKKEHEEQRRKLDLKRRLLEIAAGLTVFGMMLMLIGKMLERLGL